MVYQQDEFKMTTNKIFGTAGALALLLGTSMTQAADVANENGNGINPGITTLLLLDTSESPPDVVQVFVTSETFDGNLGGLAGADTQCTSAANTAGYGGNWTDVGGGSPCDSTRRLYCFSARASSEV